MPLGPQYSSELGNTSMSMNGLQGLARAPLAEFAVGVTQADRGLARIHAGSEHFPIRTGS